MTQEEHIKEILYLLESIEIKDVEIEITYYEALAKELLGKETQPPEATIVIRGKQIEESRV